MQDKLLTAIGVTAILWYFTSIIYVGATEPPIAGSKHTAVAAESQSASPADLRAFMALSVTSIGGTLATFIGLAVGLNESRAASGATAGTAAQQLSKYQLAAAWAYVASLVLAIVLWLIYQEKLDATIVNLAKSLLGLIGGVLAVKLNVGPSPATNP